MVRVIKYALGVLAIAGCALWLSLGYKVGTALPDHALLLVNTQTNSYATVPCVIRGAVDQSYVANVEAVSAGTEDVWYEPFVQSMTKKEAKLADMRPDRRCADADGFISWGSWLSNLPGWRKERVDPDGTVLW